ncbi:hypothetical protein BN109_011 [Yersinia phage phi80-18]|uniref:Uncharacterized protein n=1 Tax=Yersinia phage phi80-18 TaxID=1206559 RepID=I7KRH8_9CAUD|nr:hypothetical protein BN109_011 [Yersinia phage phi80-18]CCI88850.2 hypothetical protein BN109_011 [Yersinia phage phi80-18]
MTTIIQCLKAPVRDRKPEFGIPYTWGAGLMWYARTAENHTVLLNSTTNGIYSVDGSSHTIDLPEFRYATKMEIE